MPGQQPIRLTPPNPDSKRPLKGVRWVWLERDWVTVRVSIAVAKTVIPRGKRELAHEADFESEQRLKEMQQPYPFDIIAGTQVSRPTQTSRVANLRASPSYLPSLASRAIGPLSSARLAEAARQRGETRARSPGRSTPVVGVR